MNRHTRLLSRFALFIALVALWQLFSAGNSRRVFLFSTPAIVAQRFWTDLITGVLLQHAYVTIAEAAVGFAFATLAGTTIGLLLATSIMVAEIVAPYLRTLGTVPIYALAPMTIVWFGIGFWQKVGIAFFSCVFVAASQAFHGASKPPDDQLLLFRTFHASRWQTLWKLRLPVALAWVAAGCRLNVGFAILGAFLGEIISSNAGLGHYIVRASSLYDVPRVLTGVIALIFVAYLLDRAVTILFVARARWLRT